jgi:hypothetical protein
MPNLTNTPIAFDSYGWLGGESIRPSFSQATDVYSNGGSRPETSETKHSSGGAKETSMSAVQRQRPSPLPISLRTNQVPFLHSYRTFCTRLPAELKAALQNTIALAR